MENTEVLDRISRAPWLKISILSQKSSRSHRNTVFGFSKSWMGSSLKHSRVLGGDAMTVLQNINHTCLIISSLDYTDVKVIVKGFC